MTEQAKNTDKQYLTLTASFQDFSDQDQEIQARFCKPTKSAWDRYVTEMGKGRTQQAQRNLLIACIHPDDKDTLLKALDEHLALSASFAAEIGKRMGLDSLGK